MNDLFEKEEFEQQYEVNEHNLGNFKLKIREFTFHRFNGNQVWPGNQIFAEFLLKNTDFLLDKRVLEIGSGSGILSIFLKKIGVDITVSDCPDQEIFDNIDYNCILNNLDPLPKLPCNFYTDLWGEPISITKFPLIIASDILIYLKSFPDLIKSINFLLAEGGVMWLNNRRRINTEGIFLDMCISEGYKVAEIFPKVFQLTKNS
jgi:predicted nicotinamide N-methyase